MSGGMPATPRKHDIRRLNYPLGAGLFYPQGTGGHVVVSGPPRSSQVILSSLSCREATRSQPWTAQDNSVPRATLGGSGQL
jgi:hypothetical protein